MTLTMTITMANIFPRHPTSLTLMKLETSSLFRQDSKIRIVKFTVRMFFLITHFEENKILSETPELFLSLTPAEFFRGQTHF